MTKSKMSKTWEIVPIDGQKPEPRYCHSMNFMKKTGIALIIGGKNAYDVVINDSWVLDIVNLVWIKVSYVEPNNILTTK